MTENQPDQPPRAPLSPQSVHLIRTAQGNTLALSQMADGKANILIGATFVVFSLVITQAFSDDVKWSVICLAVTAFLSAISAVLAITPPMRAKAVLFAAVAYFVTPLDLLPDFITGLGFTDDATVLATALGLVGMHVKETHRTAARRLLRMPDPIQED